jgi:NAD-dependent deacetylase
MIDDALRECSVLIVIGTSGVVYPAAGFVITAKLMGARTVAINLENPDNLGYIDEFYQGKSGELLPKLVDMWISG